MKNAIKPLVFMLSLVFMLFADLADKPFQNGIFVREAQAIVGRPRTPASYAGVARRTTRRVVGTTAVATTTASAYHDSAPPPPAQPAAAPAVSAVPIGTVVMALPDGCTSVVAGGVNYSDCGGVFYKAAFQGNNLVYVVVEKPFD